MNELQIPSVDEIRRARDKLGSKVRRTPVWQWKGETKDRIFGPNTDLFLKLELLQYGGSFKCRGSLAHALTLSNEESNRGVTGVSAGNHAIAVAFAAKATGTSAKVVMPETANTARIERCKSLGAEVVLTKNVREAFAKVRQIEQQEGRYFIHPFESPLTVLGTATVGLELFEQVKDLDAVVVPVGGGGLIAGIASCIKQIKPGTKIFGVEPSGADTMSRSFASNRPEEMESVNTFADSLAAPSAEPYTFGLSRKFVDQIVTVSDKQMALTMQLLFDEMKLAVEPAAASATAALRYQLLDELQGQRVGLIICGANIDLQTYYRNIVDQT